MKNYLKKFESFKKEKQDKIHQICEQYNIRNYTITYNGSINVDDDVYLSDFNLSELPISFNKVSGYFGCSSNKLTTLKGAPLYVKSDFFCSDNELTTLEGAPQSVDGDFNCSHNYLTTLEGAPQSVGDSFNCHSNNLTTLKGAPTSVGIFDCSFNYKLK